MVKVAKFGGSSVRDGAAMKRCARILTLDPEIKLVIISATWNTTNELERIAGLAARAGAWEQALEELITRHRALIHELDLEEGEWFNSLDDEAWELGDLFREEMRVDQVRMEQFYSIGERLSSAIFAEYLSRSFLQRKVQLVDARDIIHTDNCYGLANPDRGELKEFANYHLNFNEESLFVTQGFIGRGPHGETTTLGREGSDYSATLLAEAIGASEVQIWTDVPGIAVIDPKLVADAPFIKELDYSCAEEMARHGAKVLFPRTLEPVVEAGIPVFVGTTQNPSLGGTWIKSGVFSDGVVGIAFHERGGEVIATVVGRYDDSLLSDWKTHASARRALSTTLKLSKERWPDFVEFAKKQLF